MHHGQHPMLDRESVWSSCALIGVGRFKGELEQATYILVLEQFRDSKEQSSCLLSTECLANV